MTGLNVELLKRLQKTSDGEREILLDFMADIIDAKNGSERMIAKNKLENRIKSYVKTGGRIN